MFIEIQLEEQKYAFGRMGNILSNFCNNKLYDYFKLQKKNLNRDNIHRDNDVQWGPL